MAGEQEPVRWAMLAFVAATAAAETRPDESALFGAAESATLPASATAAESAPAVKSTEAAPENPLAIGGQLYLRESVTAASGLGAAGWSHSAPMLADGWFDARPNPRVRAMLLARMSFDPTIPSSTTTFLGPTPSGGPSVALDQAWMNFDLGHVAFVTAGRQHVKWGVARFWNPNDLLHATRRDALAQFDARTGRTMIKLHLPWERKGWNFYAIQLLESLAPAATLGRVGGAARAEVVAGPAELGLDALVQRGFRPRAGADLSAGVGPIDVYAEGVIQKGTDRPLWRRAVIQPPGGTALETYTPDKLVGSVSGGLSWAFNLTDRDVMSLGAEYFYNPAGYTDKAIYPWLVFQGSFAPFYVARDYGAAYVFFSVPGTNGNQTLTLSTLANLSDRTAVARADWTILALTHLRVETYAAGRYGAAGGEFRFALDLPAQTINGIPIPAIKTPPPVAEAGVALRVSF